MKEPLKKALKIPIYPLIRYFGPRFDNIHARLDQTNHHLAQMESRLREFEQRVLTDVETTLELFVTLQRTAGMLDQRLTELQLLLAAEPKAFTDLNSQAPRA